MITLSWMNVNMWSGLHIRVFNRDGASSLGRHVRGIRNILVMIKAHFKILSTDCVDTNFFFFQIFPIHIKGVAGSLVVLVNWLGAWAVSYTFNYMMSWSSTGEFDQQPSILTLFFIRRLQTHQDLIFFSWKNFRHIFYLCCILLDDNSVCGQDYAWD